MYIRENLEQKEKSDRELQIYDKDINNAIKGFAKTKEDIKS